MTTMTMTARRMKSNNKAWRFLPCDFFLPLFLSGHFDLAVGAVAIFGFL